MMRLILSLAVLAGCSGPLADEVRWRNGDTMSGDLIEGGEGRIRWSSPHWPEPWALEAGALSSIEFGRPGSVPDGTWRILTHAGDSLIADLEGAGDDHFHIGCPVAGLRRIRRDDVRLMERAEHPGRIFLAENHRDWLERNRGPILDLRYRIHHPPEGWDAGWREPVFDDLEPIAEGSLPKGWIDFGVASFEEPLAVVFEGEIDLPDTVGHISLRSDESRNEEKANWSRLGVGTHNRMFLDLREGIVPAAAFGSLSRMPGRHPLRFEFVGDGPEHLRHVGMYPGRYLGSLHIHPDHPSSLLYRGAGLIPGWHAGPEGRLRTDRRNVRVLGPVEMPESFELEVELSSSSSPRFTLGLGRTMVNAASFDAFRLETWDDALVVTRGNAFEPLGILDDNDRELRIRLRYNGAKRLLQAFDFAGNLLTRWDGAVIDRGPSGICLINRGADLAVGRVCLTRLDGWTEIGSFHRPRVRLSGGEVLRGSLRYDPDTGSWSVTSGEDRRDVELGRVDRVVHAPGRIAGDSSDAILIYGRGVRIRGRLLRVSPDAVILSTDLSEEPVSCSRDGLESILFLSDSKRRSSPDSVLKTDAFSLKGRLELEEGEDSLRWLPEGAVRSQPIPPRIEGRIERELAGSRPDASPHRIRLHGNISLPGRLISLDEERLVMEAPLLGRRSIAFRRLRAIEWGGNPLRLVRREPDAEERRMFREWWLGVRRELPPGLPPELFDEIQGFMNPGDRAPRESPDDAEVRKRIEQILRIPGSRGREPPTHLVVERNGDFLRGDLISIGQDFLRLETRSGIKTLDLDLVRQVVRIAGPEEPEGEDRIRVMIRDGTMLEGGIAASDGENLMLESPALGLCAIPLSMIGELTLGDFEASRHPDPYLDWVARPSDPDGIE